MTSIYRKFMIEEKFWYDDNVMIVPWNRLISIENHSNKKLHDLDFQLIEMIRYSYYYYYSDQFELVLQNKEQFQIFPIEYREKVLRMLTEQMTI